MNILLSSIGRRVGLLRCFEEALGRLGLPGAAGGFDAAAHAPAAYAAACFDRVPRLDHPRFEAALRDVIARRGADLIVPTIDTELCFYAQRRRALGATVAVSEPESIRLTADKMVTHRWLVEQGFPTVRQATSAAAALQLELPVIVKPPRGSASQGVRRIETRSELGATFEASPELIAEEVAPGREYTVNAYVNRAGACVAAIPHRRVAVRGGEVSKAVTERHEGLQDVARRIVEALPGAWGALNVQAFVDGDEIRVIEINARFGGGYPLADRAGGRFAEWLLRETRGEDPPRRVEDWRAGLAMLRYDEAVFVDSEGVL